MNKIYKVIAKIALNKNSKNVQVKKIIINYILLLVPGPGAYNMSYGTIN